MEPPQPPSLLLRESAQRWLAEHEIEAAQLRLPFDLRYGDGTIPAHFLSGIDTPQLCSLGDLDLPASHRLFDPQTDNAGNLQLFTTPLHAAHLLESASPWLIGRANRSMLELDRTESDATATAVLRVAGLWQHCTGEIDTIRSDASFDLLTESPLAHTLLRLLLRADRVTDETRTLWHEQLVEGIGNIYHTIRVVTAVHPRRDAWLRLLRLGALALRL